MPVQCSEYKDCPIENCPHKEPHRNYLKIKDTGDVKICCDERKRMCGLRFPKEKVTVICLPIEEQSVKMGERLEAVLA